MKRINQNIIRFIRSYNITFLMYIFFISIVYIAVLLEAVSPFIIHLPLILAFIPISYSALQKLREKKIGTEFFLTIATIVSLIGHQEKAMTIVLIIMLLAQYLEGLITNRTEQAIKSLMNLIPKKALIIQNGEEKIIPIHEIQPGMLVIVKTGGRVPVDGIIEHGQASMNESSLTGESTPINKTVNSHVYAGTFIQSGSITIKAEKVGDETFFGKISSLVQAVEQKKKAKISLLADKIAAYLVPTLLALIALTWVLTHNLNLITTLLVFGSPLELTLITPLAILAGVIAAFRNGILVKGGLALETFSKADTIIFDKTGTLTIGEPEVIKIQTLMPTINENEILKIAAIAEKRSDHIWAKAILKKALERGISIPEPEGYQSVAGHGVQIKYGNQQCFLGNKHFIQAPEHGNISLSRDVEEPEKESSSFYVGCDGQLLGKIYIADKIRTDAAQTIDQLKDGGIRNIILLSGDKQSIASHIALLLNIPQAHGEIFPDQKLRMIEDLQKQKHLVAMVGDGINDAPALKQANVGIAMGAMGMEPAIQAADIVLITNDLYKVVFVHALSKRIFAVIRQNLLIGFALIHGIGITLTFLGYIDPLKAALFHSISDIAILINSARLINFKA